jgi:flagellar biosynthesis protein FlhA
VVATHLSEVVRSQAKELLGRQDVQGLIDQVKATHPAVVEGLIPNVLPLGVVHKVLQHLLAEAVSIRDLTTILETLADYGHATKDPVALTEYARSALAKVVVKPFLSPDGSLKPFVLSPGSEQVIADSLADGGNVVMDPRVAQRLIEAVAGTVERAHPLDSKPVIMVGAHLRGPLRRLLERPFPHLGVLSYSEIPPSLNVHAIGSIDLVGEPNETPLVGARRG